MLKQRRHPLTVFSLGFLLEIILDATLTGNASPMLPAHPMWAVYAGIPFVILGDARFFWLCERTLQGPSRTALTRPTSPRWLLAALGVALVGPATLLIAVGLTGEYFRDARKMFLFYELSLLLVIGVYGALRMRPALNGVGPAKAKWLRGLLWFVLLQYGCWASADIFILLGFEGAYAVRFVANTLYYGLFLPWAWATVPASLYEPERGAPAI